MSDKVVPLHDGIIHDNHLLAGQLFDPKDVVEGAPIDECDEVVILCRTREGKLYIGATHSCSVVSLMLGQASDWVHAAYEVYEG